MWQALRLFSSFLIILCGGVLVTRSLGRGSTRENGLIWMAWGYGLGLGFLSLAMYFLVWFGYAWSLERIILVYCFIVAIAATLFYCLFGQRASVKEIRSEAPGRKGGLLHRLLRGFILLLVIASIATCMSLPLSSWDAVVLWGYKAKILYTERTIPRSYFTDNTTHFTNPGYPLLIPLSEAFVYLGLGRVDEGWVKLLFPLFYLCLIVVFYDFGRRFFGGRRALLFAFFLAAVPHLFGHSVIGYTDLPLTFYYSAGTFLLLIWMRRHSARTLVLAAVFTGLGAWTKGEGMALAAVNLFLLLVFLRGERDLAFPAKARAVCIFVLPSLAVVVPWAVYMRQIGVQQEFAQNAGAALRLSSYARLPSIMKALGLELTKISRWNILWPALGVAVVLYFPRIRIFPANYLCAALVLQVALYVGIFVITPRNLEWHLATALDRLVLHLVPLALGFLMALWPVSPGEAPATVAGLSPKL